MEIFVINLQKENAIKLTRNKKLDFSTFAI